MADRKSDVLWESVPEQGTCNLVVCPLEDLGTGIRVPSLGVTSTSPIMISYIMVALAAVCCCFRGFSSSLDTSSVALLVGCESSRILLAERRCVISRL